MPRGRNRRSAADAVARPLALALALVVSTLPRAAHSQSQDLALRTTTCDNVPEPFSIITRSRGASPALPDFGVTCGPNREAMLSIGGDAYRIDFVSVPGSYVVIFAEPITQTQVCYERSTTAKASRRRTPEPGQSDKDLGQGGTTFTWSLEGSPFTFSKSNRLVNLGCNVTARSWLASTRLVIPARCYTPAAPPCATPLTSAALALGKACCEASMDQVNGAKVFSLSFERTTANGIGGDEDGTCSAAFFLDKARNALHRAYKARGENVGAWRQACYAPLVDIAARHGFDIDAVFAAHPRLAIWYVPTRLRQLCHQARGSHAHVHVHAAHAHAAGGFPPPPMF